MPTNLKMDMPDQGSQNEDRVQRAERLAREILARRMNAAQEAPEEETSQQDMGDTPPLAPDESDLGDLPPGDHDPAQDVDVRAAFDRVHQRDMGALDRFDPEAGKLGLGTRIQNVVRASVHSPFGRFIVSIAIALAGVSLAIVAFTFLTWPLLVAAGILTPITLIYLYVRYQQWLGHKRYIFRLLETLGEDVSDFDITQRYRAGKVRKSR